MTVKPRSRTNQVIDTGEDTFTVLTTAAAEGGKANEQVLNLLAAHFKIGKSRLRIVLGKTAREKLIEVAD